MKTNLLILTFLAGLSGLAQQDSAQKALHNEIKANLFNLAAFNAADLSYEYLLNENQSIGIGILMKLKPEIKEGYLFRFEIDETRNLSITPYYRYFFSRKYARGFFVEGFAMYASGKEFEPYLNNMQTSEEREIKPYDYFGIGVGLGVKFLLAKVLAVEINFGASNAIGFDGRSTTRGGVSFGYRF